VLDALDRGDLQAFVHASCCLAELAEEAIVLSGHGGRILRRNHDVATERALRAHDGTITSGVAPASLSHVRSEVVLQKALGQVAFSPYAGRYRLDVLNLFLTHQVVRS
jgi:hypothetical protein